MHDAVTDEQLMAFADGVLDPDRAAAVQAAIDADPELARRAAMFRDSAALLAGLGQALPSDVPDRVAARARELAAETRAPAPVADLATHRARAEAAPNAARRVPLWQVPLAASIFLAIGITAGSLIPRSGPGPGQLAALDAPAMQVALRTLPSGEARALDSGQVTMIGSFANAEGQLCREFEYDPPTGQTVVSVACHDGGAWGVRMAVLAAPVDATGYAPASSLEVVDAYLQASGAGAQMDPKEEAAALQQLP